MYQITVTLTSACRFSAKDHALQYAEQTTVKCPSFFRFRTEFCRRAEHFNDCRWAPPQVRFFAKFRRRRTNWSQTVTTFRTFCLASEINFLQQPVHACPGPILPGKLSEQTLWAL